MTSTTIHQLMCASAWRCAMLALLAGGVAGVPATTTGQESEALTAIPHGRAFWEELRAKGFPAPTIARPFELLMAADSLLASRDPVLRDAIGYEAVVAWVYKAPLLSRDEIARLASHWSANLQRGLGERGLGERGPDGVLLRSFSALCLSVVAAADLRSSSLTVDEHRALTAATLAYLAAERDLRAYDASVGWMHATAHTADLLKFLARSPKEPADVQARVLAATSAKLTTAGEIFTHGEQARLAAALASLVGRSDFDAGAFDAWLDARRDEARSLWSTMPRIDHERFVGVQNHKHLLEALVVALSADASSAPAKAATRRVVATLGAM